MCLSPKSIGKIQWLALSRAENIRMFLARISFNRRYLGIWQLSALYLGPPSPCSISVTTQKFSSCHWKSGHNKSTYCLFSGTVDSSKSLEAELRIMHWAFEFQEKILNLTLVINITHIALLSPSHFIFLSIEDCQKANMYLGGYTEQCKFIFKELWSLITVSKSAISWVECMSE